MLFTDTITLYTQTKVTETVGDITTETEKWERTIVNGVQWSDSYERQINSGIVEVAPVITITFPQGTYENIVLDSSKEADAIFYGEIDEEITGQRGHRLSDALNKYPRSGRIKSVNDNSNRTFLKNKKVVIV